MLPFSSVYASANRKWHSALVISPYHSDISTGGKACCDPAPCMTSQCWLGLARFFESDWWEWEVGRRFLTFHISVPTVKILLLLIIYVLLLACDLARLLDYSMDQQALANKILFTLYIQGLTGLIQLPWDIFRCHLIYPSLSILKERESYMDIEAILGPSCLLWFFKSQASRLWKQGECGCGHRCAMVSNFFTLCFLLTMSKCSCGTSLLSYSSFARYTI